MQRSRAIPPKPLSVQHERWLYASSGLLWLSGTGWLVAHYWLPRPSGLAELPHPAEPWSLRLHGAALLVFLLSVGALLPQHVVRGWRGRAEADIGAHWHSGLWTLLAIAVLTLTGYGLYYLGDERLRAAVSVVHWSVGLVGAAALVTHAWLGHRRQARRRLSLR